MSIYVRRDVYDMCRGCEGARVLSGCVNMERVYE